MLTKTQPPGPTTSPPKLARSRKAVNFKQTIGRPGSAGGIVLYGQQGSTEKNMNSKFATKVATTPATKDAASAAAAGPNRQRRRPRKLNKEPTAQPSTPTSTVTNTTATPKPAAAAPAIVNEPPTPVSTLELEALKSRVRGLEAKVEQLYSSSTDALSARSPRRRGKARKGSSATTIPTLSTTTADTGKVDDANEEEADEELVRLEDELEVARQDLEAYRPTTRRPRTRRSASSAVEEEIEEILRDNFATGTGIEEDVKKGDRQVTLTGNYRIPLPTSVSMTDVKNIQSGVSAAQNVAKSFLEQRRAQAKLNPTVTAVKTQTPPQKKGKQATTSTAVSTERTAEAEGGKSWGEWFGGYSVAISRAVKTIEAEAALESQTAGGKREAGPIASSGKSKATAKGKGNAGVITKTGPRPPLKPRAGNLSSEQVQGLMK